MTQFARIAGLALAILSLVSGVAVVPSSPEMPPPEKTGAAVVAAVGLDVPEGVDLATIGRAVQAAMPVEANLGTADGIGTNLAELLRAPPGVDTAALGQAVIDATPAVRAALAGGDWSAVVWAVIGLLVGLAMAWLGGRKRVAIVPVAIILMAGCAHQSVQGAVLVDVKAGPGGGVFAKAEGDPDYRVSLTGDGVTTLAALCGLGEKPVGVDREEVACGAEKCSRWRLTCVDADERVSVRTWLSDGGS